MIMKTVITLLTATLLLVGCSGHLNTPAVSFGKKCAETNDGQIAYSYVWLYSKNEGLKANKEDCNLIANKK